MPVLSVQALASVRVSGRVELKGSKPGIRIEPVALAVVCSVSTHELVS